MKLKFILLVFTLINNFNASVFAAQNNDVFGELDPLDERILDKDGDCSLADISDSLLQKDLQDSEEKDKKIDSQKNDGHLSAALVDLSSAPIAENTETIAADYTSIDAELDNNDDDQQSEMPQVLQGNINGTGSGAPKLDAQTKKIATVIAKQKTGVKRKAESMSESDSATDQESDSNDNVENSEDKIESTKKIKLTADKESNKTKQKHFCNVCSKSFSAKSSLIRHEKTHTSKKPFKCKICFKGFSRNHDLNNHNLTHSGGKPCVCNFDGCGKSFLTSSHLLIHERTHTGEKPFVCKYCDKKFTQSSNLKSHERIHTGETPYACDVEGCDKKYRKKSSLINHKKKHGQGK